MLPLSTRAIHTRGERLQNYTFSRKYTFDFLYWLILKNYRHYSSTVVSDSTEDSEFTEDFDFSEVSSPSTSSLGSSFF